MKKGGKNLNVGYTTPVRRRSCPFVDVVFMSEKGQFLLFVCDDRSTLNIVFYIS